MDENGKSQTTHPTLLECQYRIADAAYDYWMVRSPIGRDHDLWYWHFARLYLQDRAREREPIRGDDAHAHIRNSSS